MPQLTDLWFSGGEPTLRRELEDIIDLFVRNYGVRRINLPTNGLKPSRIYEIADRCLARHRNLDLHINIALDGLTDSHDAMRGVPGNFDKAIESARVLRRLKPQFGRRLEVHINTVITRDNIDEVLPLAEWIFAERLVDGHYFNLIRGDARNPALKEIQRVFDLPLSDVPADPWWSYNVDHTRDLDARFDALIEFVGDKYK